MFLVVVVSAAGTVALLLVVRGLCQAASQGTAAAVAERAGQGLVAEGDDAALEYADGAVVPPAVAEGEADADAEILDKPVQFFPGCRICTDRLDPIHERHGLLDLRLDARRRLVTRHPLFNFGVCLLGFGQFGMQIAEPCPERSPEIVVVFFENSLRILGNLPRFRRAMAKAAEWPHDYRPHHDS